MFRQGTSVASLLPVGGLMKNQTARPLRVVAPIADEGDFEISEEAPEPIDLLMPQQDRAPWVIAGLALLGLIGLTGYILMGNPQPEPPVTATTPSPSPAFPDAIAPPEPPQAQFDEAIAAAQVHLASLVAVTHPAPPLAPAKTSSHRRVKTTWVKKSGLGDAGTKASRWVGLGHARLERGRFAAALTQFKKTVARWPKSAEAWYGLALARTELKLNRLARAAAKKALRLDPSHQGATLLLGFLAQQKNDVAAARRLYAKALELDPQGPLASELSSVLLQLQPQPAYVRR